MGLSNRTKLAGAISGVVCGGFAAVGSATCFAVTHEPAWQPLAYGAFFWVVGFLAIVVVNGALDRWG